MGTCLSSCRYHSDSPFPSLITAPRHHISEDQHRSLWILVTYTYASIVKMAQASHDIVALRISVTPQVRIPDLPFVGKRT